MQVRESIKQAVQICLTKNEEKMLPSEYLYFLKGCDFSGIYGRFLSDYWSKYYDKFKLLLKIIIFPQLYIFIKTEKLMNMNIISLLAH